MYTVGTLAGDNGTLYNGLGYTMVMQWHSRARGLYNGTQGVIIFLGCYQFQEHFLCHEASDWSAI